MLSVIGEMLQTLRDFFPRTANIGPGEIGLLKRFGRYREVTPRFCVYWPMWSELEVHQANHHSIFVTEPIEVDGEIKVARVRLLVELDNICKAAHKSVDWVTAIDDVVVQCLIEAQRKQWSLRRFKNKVSMSLEEFGIRTISVTYNIHGTTHITADVEGVGERNV